MNEVLVEFNPYIPELEVYINNKRLSKFSSIETFKNMPFVDWCGYLFQELYREVNDAYDLIFEGTEFESEILEVFAKKDSHCKSFKTREPQLNQSIYERLTLLDNLGCDIDAEIFIDLLSNYKSLANGMFEILQESELFVAQSNDEMICDECAGITIYIKKNIIDYELEVIKGSDLHIIILDSYPSDELLDEINDIDENVYIFCVGTDAHFIEKVNKVYIYSIDSDNLSEYLMKVLSGVKLSGLLADSAYAFTEKNNSDISILTEQEKMLLEQICLTRPKYKVSMPLTMYKSRSADIEVIEIPSINDNEYIIKSDNPSVIDINQKTITAMSSGTSHISIFKNGSPEIIFEQEIIVSDAALIESITLFPKYKELGVDSSANIEICFEPSNAQNSHELEWLSDNKAIATIDNTGCIQAKSCGNCNIIVKAGTVSETMQIRVMPSIEDIICKSSYVEIVSGESVEWKYALNPEDCFERDLIKVCSSDENIAYYRGGRIFGKSPGLANISVYTPDCRIKKNCRVTVTKKRLFR